MKKTRQMIEEFLQQVEEDKVLADKKLKELEARRCELDAERSEISKAVIRMDNEGNQDAVNKLNNELANRVNEIGVLDSKIEAYREMGTSYQAEAEKVFIVAAKEYNEDFPKVLDQANDKLVKARAALEEAKELVRKQEGALRVAEQEVSSIKNSMKYVVDDRLKEIEKYLPKKINTLIVPEAKGHYETVQNEDERTVQKYVEDTVNYGDGMEGKLTYYYKEVMPKQTVAPKKKSLVDKILGR